MARVCGECTLCCKLESIKEIDKPSWNWCQHCDIGVGCKIYSAKPKACNYFRCLWLDDLDMPDAMRPDRAGVYIAKSNDCLKACVDEKIEGIGFEVIRYARSKGHVIVHHKQQINFLCGDNMQMPEKLLLDWTL